MKYMLQRRVLPRNLAALLISCSIAGVAGAQEFGEMLDFDAAGEAAADNDAPGGQINPQAPDTAAIPLGSSGNLAVDIIGQSNPQTAHELLEAVRNLLDLNERALAKEFLGRWAQLPLNDLERKRLVEQFGEPFLLRMASDDKLAPEGRAIATELMEASHRIVRDPAEIARRLEQLRSDDSDLQMAARRSLREAGSAAAQPLLDALVTSEGKQRSEYFRALISLGRDAQQPLAEALGNPAPQTRAAALEALTYTGDQNIVAIAAAMYHRDEDDQVRGHAATLLRRRVGSLPSYQDAVQHLRDEVKIEIENLWPKAAAYAASPSPARSERAETVARIDRLGTWLQRLAPDAAEDRYWVAVARLTSWSAEHGRAGSLSETDPELFQFLSAWPNDQLESLLDRAMDDQFLGAAIGLVQVLEVTGSPSLLVGIHGTPRPLARALSNPDRRLAIAAAKAIIHLDPTGPFPGASQLVELAGFLARSEGTPRALVIHSRADQAGNVIGWLHDLGMATDLATSARAAEQMAASHPDYELILLSDQVGGSWYELYQRLRRQPRVRSIPMALIVRHDLAADSEVVAVADPMAISYPFPYQRETVQDIVRLTRPLGERSVVPPAERLQQAQTAIQWLDRMSEDRQRYQYLEVLPWQPTLLNALHVPLLSRDAMRALGHLATPQAQWGLVDYASQSTIPLDDRQAAANAFRYAAAKHGVQLSLSQIGCQYDRFEELASLDAESSKVLGFILDVIEANSAEVLGNRNRS